VRDQVEQHPRDLLREQIDLAGRRVEGPLQGNDEALLLGPRPVIGEIEAFLHQGVDLDRAVFPWRECSSMFLTMASARLPCCTTLSRLPCSVSAISVISARSLLSRLAPARASRSSSISSAETAEKLLTKLSGFLISCAMPAVSCPSEASFSVCTRRSCAARRSSSDFANSRVRASTFSNSRTFSIAIAAWSAKVVTSSI